MCIACPVIAGVVITGSLIVGAIKKKWPSSQPQPKSLPLAVYGEDLED